MADDDDNNTGAGAALPTEEEENSVVGDIEQGRSSSSWVAVAVSGRTSTADPSTTTTTTWPQGGLEHVDVEEAAPVLPLIQQIADMEIEKDDANANIHANVAPSEANHDKERKSKQMGRKTFAAVDILEARLNDKILTGSLNTNTNINADMASEDASTTPQPPKQGAMEQIEDGDDAAPRPLNSAEFEDESKAKLDLGEESADEDEGPPIPLSQQRDSMSNAKEKMVAASPQIEASDAVSSIDGNQPIVQQMDERRIPARQVVSPAERYPSMPIVEAYLVMEEGGSDDIPPPAAVVTPGGHDTVYEATPVEPELPWWKQRRTKVFMVIICVLIAALLAVSLGVVFSRPPAASPTEDELTAPNTTISTSGPIGMSGASSPVSLTPTQSPTAPSYRCFVDSKELKTVVNLYVKNGCGAVATLCPDVSETYGWPIGSWCIVGEVTDMSRLFEGLDTFDEDISGWNMSSVTSMREMFKGATSFNQNLCAWKDNFPYSNGNDIFVDSGCAFKVSPSAATKGPFCASSCNTATAATECFTTRNELKAAVDQYVQGYWGTADSSKYGWPIGSWCVGNVTDMSGLFESLDTFNDDISGWNVGRVTDMSYMFYNATSFNPEDLSNWDTSSVTTMMSMFSWASTFDGNISSWNTSAVTDMSYMFSNAISFDQKDLTNWDTSAVTTMYAMFERASAFDGNISSWNTAAVTDMTWMFHYATSFNGNIASWNTSKVTTMKDMFSASSFVRDDLSNWDTSAVTNMRGMFYLNPAFDGNISSWDTSAVTDMDYMFYAASSFNGNISSWNTSSVTTMAHMFSWASTFDGNISSWDTSAVTDMTNMFFGASSFNQDLCAWKDNFPYSNANDIFVGSGCTFQGSPQFEQQGPFCASNCTSTSGERLQRSIRLNE